ncbi:MAG: hypothetical protein GX328_02160 [Clostridiaceae bacterium]|nr:hypothetical protein [Clostridiaceae bacterium]
MSNNNIANRNIGFFQKFIVAILSLLPVLGHISITTIKLFGITLTPYRVFIPLIFFYFLFMNLKNGWSEFLLNLKRKYGKYNVFFVITFLAFMIYGLILLFLAPMVDKRAGLFELINIGLGFLMIINIFEISFIEGGLKLWLKILKIVFFIILSLGFIEIIMGFHLPFSRYSDPEILRYFSLQEKIINIATGLYYNENDYSAFIVLFSPIVLFKVNKKCRLLNFLGLTLISIVVSLNDSWICIIALLIGILFWVFLEKFSLKKIVLYLGNIIISHTIISSLLARFINKLNDYRYKKAKIGLDQSRKFRPKKVVGAIEKVQQQFDAANSKMGSLHQRTNTYLSSSLEMFTQTYGLGFGPGSFGNVIKQMDQPNLLLNPHCLWIEILVQYGLIIFVLFVLFILSLFVHIIKKYREKPHSLLSFVLTMDLVFVFVAFSSSSWLNSPLIWIPIGLSLIMTRKDINVLLDDFS